MRVCVYKAWKNGHVAQVQIGWETSMRFYRNNPLPTNGDYSSGQWRTADGENPPCGQRRGCLVAMAHDEHSVATLAGFNNKPQASAIV